MQWSDLVLLAYYVAMILLAYRIGRNRPGYGIALFLFAVFLHQIVVDGPSSFLSGSGCADYGVRAKDC